jgi:hypothetical protein
MNPTRIHAKVIAGKDVKKESITTVTSITADIITGIVSRKSSFLWSRFLTFRR